MEKESKNQLIKFVLKVTYAHTISWFVAGVIAVYLMSYEQWFLTEPMSFMRPTTEPIIRLGMALQIFRGVLVGFVLYPVRKVFFEERLGYWKLGLVILGLSVVATFGPAPGSFDGYIFTNLPLSMHLACYPEALLWISSFIGILYISNKYENKKIARIIPMVFTILIVLMGIMSYMEAKGYF